MRAFVFWDRTLWHVDDISRTLHAFKGRQVWIVFDLWVNLLQPGQMWLGGVVSSLCRNAARRPGVQSPSLGAEEHCPLKNLIFVKQVLVKILTLVPCVLVRVQPDPAAGLADGEDDGRRSILRLQLEEGRRLQQRAELAQVVDPREE